MSQTINGLEIARDTLIFLLQSLRFLINLQKSVLEPLQKIEFLGLEIDSVRMTLTLPLEKVKKIETEIPKAYFKPQNATMGSDQPFRFSLLNEDLGGVLSESVNRRLVVSPGVKPPCQCSGIVSHQTSPFNVFENVQSHKSIHFQVDNMSAFLT